jgi:hypothetical protein
MKGLFFVKTRNITKQEEEHVSAAVDLTVDFISSKAVVKAFRTKV